MKIIQVIPFLGMGGAEIMCENLTYELIKLGHEIIIVSLYNKKTPITERLENSNIDIRYLDKKDGLDFSMFGKFRSLLKKEKPDLVHTHLYVTKYVFPITKLLRIKTVHTLHSIARKENSKPNRLLNKFFFKTGATIPVALSGTVRQTIIDEYGMKESAIPVVFNGIDLSKCKVKENYSQNESFQILHIGSFQPLKNHKSLIEAFARFHKIQPSNYL